MSATAAKPVDTLSILNSISASTPDLIYAFDLSYRFTYVNHAVLTMWGKTWEQAIGKSLLENGYEPWHAEMHEREIDQVVATRQPIRGEVSFPHAVLGNRIYDYIFVPVTNQQGDVEAVAGTTRDITEIRKAEDMVRKSGKQQAFLLHLNDHLKEMADPADIQYGAASLLAGYLHADRAGYAEDGGDGRTVIVTTDYTNDVTSIRGRHTYDDYGPDLLKSLREGKTIIRSNIASDPSLSKEEKEAHKALLLGAMLNVPLLRNGELLAVFFIHHRQPYSWTEDEISLVQTVAERTWDAVVRARVEKALHESEERFRTMADTVPQSIWITDDSGRAEFLNRHWCDYCGVPFSDTTAADIAVKHLHPDDAPNVMEAFGKAMQTGEPWEVEQRNLSKEGEYRWFLNRATPYRDPVTGKVTKWFGVGIDIHDRKLAEQALRKSEESLERKVMERTRELEKTNEELRQSNQNLEEFAYAASHDMKEPIRKIHFFADRLKGRLQSKLEEEDRRYFERLEMGARRMNSLIDDLLLYSHVSRGVRSTATVDLNQTLAFVLDDLELHIAEKGANVTVGPLPTIKGQQRQLQQLFENLLANALKYSKPDGVPEITIEASLVNGKEVAIQRNLNGIEGETRYHLIRIKDNGIGFLQEDAERIFTVFTRLHGNNEYKGTGVGLSIARKVAHNHGGYIWAESRQDEGATFNVLLPAE
ncbi:PAS domain S-box protein [Flavisolibacter sp. BT320]|nr:PAS domain S-box protein [Flavisolibacter longurius]